MSQETAVFAMALGAMVPAIAMGRAIAQPSTLSRSSPKRKARSRARFSSGLR